MSASATQGGYNDNHGLYGSTSCCINQRPSQWKSRISTTAYSTVALVPPMC